MLFSRLAVPFIWLSLSSFCEAWRSPRHYLTRRYNNEEIQVDASKHDKQFFSFVTRPDIDAPRWDIKIHDQDALAPGYWFMSPYGIVAQEDNQKLYVGPHIYDHNGELIWSGVPMMGGWDVFDFKVSQVNGKSMLTGIQPHMNRSFIINENYEIYANVSSGLTKVTMNMHDFQIVDDGTTALYLNKDLKRTSEKNSKEVGFDGHCYAEFTGFEERDLATEEVLFHWSPENRISLNESTMVTPHIEHACDEGEAWDYLHMNSIEKLPDGDYLASGRRSYALYKISHKNKNIIWRLGGHKSDFEFDGHFSGQHDARCLSQNSTHLVVSIMDNASGPGKPGKTNDNSRGLTISINEETMKAEVVKVYDHPHGKGNYAPGRGNFQTLPNGNAFLTWMENALQSEHTQEGKVVMEAKLLSGLKTYRGYKFPWVGRPSTAPDVHSEVVVINDEPWTSVHVSWNGDTEVATYNLHMTDHAGDFKKLVASSRRTGFETGLLYEGYAGYVVVEGLDKEGNKLGESQALQTLGYRGFAGTEDTDSSGVNGGHTVVVDSDHDALLWKDEVSSVFSLPVVAFLGGILFSIAAGLSAWAVCTARRKGAFSWMRKQQQQQLYTELPENDRDAESEEMFDQDRKIFEKERGDED